MEDIQLYIILFAVILLALIFLIKFVTDNKNRKREKMANENKKPTNQRNNFRFRVNIEDTLMEVIRIDDMYLHEKKFCELVDVSASGAGIKCNYNFPSKKDVFIKLNFKLNEEQFSINGKIVRKNETPNKKKFLYGVSFINLSISEENKLTKEIVALDHQKRKIILK